MDQEIRAGFNGSKTGDSDVGDGPGGLMLELELVAAAEDAGALDQEDDGDEPEVGFVESNGEAAEQDDGGPDEAEGPDAGSCLLQHRQTEGEEGQLLLRRPHRRPLHRCSGAAAAGFGVEAGGLWLEYGWTHAACVAHLCIHLENVEMNTAFALFW